MLRQRGPGDAYEIEPRMWRGGGRFVGERTLSMGERHVSIKRGRVGRENVNEWGVQDMCGSECELVNGSMDMGKVDGRGLKSVRGEMRNERGYESDMKMSESMPAAYMPSRQFDDFQDGSATSQSQHCARHNS